MKKIILLTLLLGYISLAQSQQVINDKIMVGDVERSYILYLPEAYVGEGLSSLPLVFNFHGFGSNAIQEQFYTGMDVVANANDFIVCYPEGLSAAWNVGWSFGSQADDIGFTSALIDKLHESYNIDLDRVYSCGMSNGGFFSYVLACELNDKIAAVASVTGSIVPAYECNPGKAVPIMQVHGTQDMTVFYNGTPDVSIPIEDVVDFWVTNNGCAGEPQVEAIDDSNTNDQSTAELIQYVDCNDNTTVQFYKIENGEHTWPGAGIDIGVTNRDFNASQEIWNFFNGYSLEGVISDTDDLQIKNDITVTPNPATNFIYLSHVDNSTPVDYKIYSADGQLIKDGSYEGKILISNLSSGLYFLQSQLNGQESIIRFVKN